MLDNSNSETSPSKDNLLISEEDLHIKTINLQLEDSPTLSDSMDDDDLKKNRNKGQNNNNHHQEKGLMGRNNSLNMSQGKGQPRSRSRSRADTEEEEVDIIGGIITSKRASPPQTKKQQNLVFAQKHSPQTFPEVGGGILKGSGGDYQDKIEYHGIDLNDEEEEDGRGPTILQVTEEVPRSYSLLGACCPRRREKRRLEEVIRRKQAERSAEFARLQTAHKLEGDNKRILNLGWEELVQALQKRELSATAVLEAYISKTLEATSKFNNVTDFIPQAFEWAKELDSMELPKGPLHGIPFCVKDDMNVEGLDTTLGYANRLYKPATETAVLVKVLMDLGAVPFCKTNVPQTLFTYGSDNPVFGATTNCINPKLSPGGSSSGTGSLVGAHGCPFGTGTDIGGSLRIPAHFNGVASIKPTVHRLSSLGTVCALPNMIGLQACTGIIGETPTIVSTVFKGICEDLQQHKNDPRIPPIPWDNALFQSKDKLRIGYFSSLSYFPAMGDTEEVCLRAKSTLESLGHTLIPFEMPDQYHYMNVVARFLLADPERQFQKDCWNQEPIADSVKLAQMVTHIPRRLQRVLGSLMKSKLFPFMYSPTTASMLGGGALTSAEIWDAQGDKVQIIQQVFEEWAKLKLDALICPVFPFAAPTISAPGMLPVAVVYSMIWNLVDFPAGVVPFGRESGKNFDNYEENDTSYKLAKKATKDSIGAPIGVQVVGLPFKEEIVLRLMKELEQFSYKH